jgi:dihydrofolate synthase/folylpolyglutamate synthase
MHNETPAAEIDWLYGLQHFGIKLGLDNIRGLLDALDHPERAYPSALIAGTNGKGSVAAMLHAMLGAAGLKAGLFTSPHLVRPTERIRIGAREIEGAELGRQLGRMRETIEAALEQGNLETHPSFFEVITATALQSFSDHGVRAAALEVGLGGRLDATNAVDGDLSIVVSIDLDHTKTLGASLERIAAEKGGIVKPGKPLVSGVVRQQAIDVLQRICRERGSTWVDANTAARFLAEEDDGTFTLETERNRYDRLRLALAGRHQIHNARVAVVAFERFAARVGLDPEPAAVRDGLAAVRWPGRLQWVRDETDGADLLLDGAHNPAGTGTLASFLAAVDRPAPVAVFGVMHGKLVAEMIEPLARRLHGIVIARPSVRRAADPEEVAAVVRRYVDLVEVVPDPSAAYCRAKELAGTERYVLVTGSLYLIGEILGLLGRRPTPGPVSM